MHARFPGSMEHLSHMLAFILDYARSLGFDKEKLGQIELAVEEALVNIIVHAYANAKGFVDLEMQVLAPKAVQIVISDQGTPFDPLSKAKGFDPEAAIRAGAVGGFGIFLMLKVMDNVSYHYKDGRNILTLTKNK